MSEPIAKPPEPSSPPSSPPPSPGEKKEPEKGLISRSTPIDDLDFSAIPFDPRLTNTVICHGPGCRDGMTAAIIIYWYLKQVDPTRRINWYLTNNRDYGPSVKGQHVVICDFSYNLETTQRMIREAASLVILDHHVTARRVLASLPKENCFFRMDHSGAYLAWRFFFRDLPVPTFVKYIEDGDIWTCALENHKEFNTALSVVPMIEPRNLERWRAENPGQIDYLQLLLDDDLVLRKIQEDGIPMWRMVQCQLKQIARGAKVELVEIDRRIVTLMSSVNSAFEKSELGNYLISQHHPWANFSKIDNYCGRDDVTKISLRSTLHHQDVEEIASLLGGGGHRNASGLSVAGECRGLPKTKVLHSDPYSVLQTIRVQVWRVMVEGRAYDLNTVYLNTADHQSAWLRLMLSHRCYHEVDEIALSKLDLEEQQDWKREPHESIQVGRSLFSHFNPSVDCGYLHLAVCFNQTAYGNNFTLRFDSCMDSSLRKGIIECLRAKSTREGHLQFSGPAHLTSL